MKVQRFDRMPVKAYRTDEGFLVDPAAVITRTGIFEYRDPKTGTITREYRPDEEIFKPSHLAAFAGLTITAGHRGKVTAANAKELTIGIITGAASKGETRGDVTDMLAPVKIWDTAPVDKDGHTELSVGYEIELDQTPGEFNGQRYDAVQRDHRPNHLAVVKAGRAKTARLNLDAADDADETETPPVIKPEQKDMKKVRLDNGLEYDAAPEVAVYLDKLVADVKAAVAAKDTQTARADAAEAKVADHEKALKTAREDGEKDARARLTLEATAKEHKVEFKADEKDMDIRVKIVKAIRGDSFDANGRTDAYIEAAYDLAIADAGKSAAARSGQRKEAVTGSAPTNGGARNDAGGEGNAPQGAAGYRQKFLTNLQNPQPAESKK